ncbi:MAG TPA: peptidoglycan-associated lipoprotein Pal [Desulfobacteraceae bacterium]|nr:peptidoglycan-associated lipoprotein Pal [Desulfobacteraceae bacterium]HPJ68405.1 peptidoglycan-associated lipoprotein Pal [Desulfobacteraceae bacterium]HPQ27237.1 peptidoglycan-associated lipoprotein Pal [Desulfobacteraceae bacterium]
MREKIIVGFITMAFLFSSLFLMAGCAKKQVVSEEGVKPSVEATQKAPVKEKAETVSDDAATEAEKQARLREIEKAKIFAEEIRAFEEANIYFDFDRSELKPEAQANLQKKAEWLRANPMHSVMIAGHCDERGTAEYNLALGERRANSAKEYLTALGISENRIETISYGEEKPADPGHNEEAWAKNRRAEFSLFK